MEHTRWLFVALTVVAFTLTAVVSPAAPSGQQVARRAFPSVVLLVMRDTRQQPLSIGSGFFVDSNTVATNAHVIEGAASGFAKVVGHEAQYAIEGTVGVDRIRDLVLLKLRGVAGTPISLADSSGVSVGDQVYAIGNPLGLEGTMSQGIVSGIRAAGDSRLIQITAPVSPGSSGGPVLNAEGGVIGVAVGTFAGGQNLNFAIPSGYVKMLRQNRTQVQPLTAVRTSGAARSLFDGIGRPGAQGVVGEKMAWGHFGSFSFSLRNQLGTAVGNVLCLVVFYDTEYDPVDYEVVECHDVIPPGLAKRVRGNVDSEVQDFIQGRLNRDPEPKARVDFRVLDFTVVQ